jgi:spermidine synthase
VEIDEKIVKIAHQYFGLPETNERFHIVIEDGMKFLQSTGTSIVFID